MRTSTAITAAVAITLCLLAIRWQRSHMSLLEQETRALREQLSAAPSQPGLPSANVGTSGAVRRSDRDRNDGKSSRRLPSIARLRALWPEGTVSTDRSAATLAIPKLVAAVEHCSSAEFLELAAGLSDHPEEGSSNEPFLQELLLIMVSEEDPAGALALWDSLFAGTKRTESVRASILSELARKNPKLALAKWDREGMGRHGQSRCRLAVAQQLLRSDPAAGLDLLQEDLGAGWGHGLNGILYAPHESRSRPRRATPK